MIALGNSVLHDQKLFTTEDTELHRVKTVFMPYSAELCVLWRAGCTNAAGAAG